MRRVNTSKIHYTHTFSSSTLLLDKIRGSWMFDEEILLLIKEERHKEAITRYVDKERFDKVEEFCVKQDKKLGLLTTLLSIYFQYYSENWKKRCELIESKQIAAAIPFKEKAEKFRDQALGLMRNYSAKNLLDPMTVLTLIPDDWELKNQEYNAIAFLSSIFDH